MDKPHDADDQSSSPDPARGSDGDRQRRRRRRAVDAAIVAAVIGAVGAVLAAIIPNLLSGDEAKPTEPPPVSEAPTHAMPPLPTPTCEGCKSGKTYQEQVGNGRGARTYRDPRVLMGEGQPVPPLRKVDVLCKLYAPVPDSPSVGKYWYLIISSPWSGRYYSTANSYLNGDSPDPTQGTHETVVDLRVPDC